MAVYFFVYIIVSRQLRFTNEFHIQGQFFFFNRDS